MNIPRSQEIRQKLGSEDVLEDENEIDIEMIDE